MAIASEYVATEDLLVVVWDGIVSGDEWDAYARNRLADDPEWPQGSRRLIDVTGLDPSALTPADAEANADLYKERGANMVGTRTAIVASRAWELATAFERRIDRLGSTTIVFNYLAEACGWLSLDPELARGIVARLRADLRRGS
jgi:hypothetical protein